jgi:hypothetical protein
VVANSSKLSPEFVVLKLAIVAPAHAVLKSAIVTNFLAVKEILLVL